MKYSSRHRSGSAAGLIQRDWNLLSEKDRLLKAVAQLATPHTYPARVFLCSQSWEAKFVYFIDRGIVKLVYTYEDGKEAIVALRGRGCAIGASSAASGATCYVSAITLTDCRIYQVPAREFMILMKTDAEFSLGLHRSISQAYYAHLGLRFGNARQKLENLLRQLIPMLNLNPLNRELKLQLPLTHCDIAGLIDVDATYVSKLLKQLEREEIIRQTKGWLIIPDPQKLRHTDYC